MRGWAWYSSLFDTAGPGDLCGESSTHYTKLPTFPRTVERMVRKLPRVKLIYVMRHPLDRLVSQYVHEVTAGTIRSGLVEAVDRHPELIDYGRYSMQLEPFLGAYGFESVLPVFFARLVNQSQHELERIGRFLGLTGPLKWDPTLRPQNTRQDRLRPSPLRHALAQSPVLCQLRRRLVPRSWSESARVFWRASIEPPEMPADLVARLREVFDADLAQLGSWLGITLDCANFDRATQTRPHGWLAGNLDSGAFSPPVQAGLAAREKRSPARGG